MHTWWSRMSSDCGNSYYHHVGARIEPSWVPLEEQTVLLTTEPSLQPCFLIWKKFLFFRCFMYCFSCFTGKFSNLPFQGWWCFALLLILLWVYDMCRCCGGQERALELQAILNCPTWGLNWGPLEEQWGLLTAELLLNPPFCYWAIETESYYITKACLGCSVWSRQPPNSHLHAPVSQRPGF